MNESRVDFVWVIQESDGIFNDDCVAVCADEATAEQYAADRRLARGQMVDVSIRKMPIIRAAPRG